MTEADVLAADLPKFHELLQSIRQVSVDVFPIFSKLTDRVNNGTLAIGNGISLLDVKNNSLLLYLVDIITIVLRKVNGLKLANSEAVARVVELRTVLEKLRPLEQKLKYQIDKVVQAATSTTKESEPNPLKFKPNLDNFKDSSEEEVEEEHLDEDMETKKYVPPHIAATEHQEQNKRLARQEKAKRNALTKSSVIAELIEESSDMPVEYSHQSYTKNKAFKMQQERKEYEEANFTRITLSRKQKALENSLFRKSELDTITSFGNIDILHNDDNHEGGPRKRKKKSKNTKQGKSKRRRK